MKAREGVMSSPVLGADLKKLYPISFADQSDTATFDNCLELLTMAGYPISQAVMMMIPSRGSSTPRWTERRRPSTSTTPRCSSRGTARPRSSSPTAARSAPRSTATACALALLRDGRRPRHHGLESGVLPVPENKIVRKWRCSPARCS
jgi:glutamate synthase (NADPH/NADH) large chain/glutamate synthase (ferredoxin)